MSYLEEMSLQLENLNFPGFMHLWEEYKTNTEISAEETIEIFKALKKFENPQLFGRYAEEALDFMDKLDQPELKPELLKQIMDLQTTNSDVLAEACLDYLSENYKNDPLFKEKVRLVGLRGGDHFQGAIRNFELLNHMDKGKFVFHTGGWGVGEIMDISLIREELAIEFESMVDIRNLSFNNAFKNLEPVSDDHFLARRFGDPDQLEQEAKENPIGVLKALLRDLGPLTAAEIKDQMYELVLPADDWAKWWQATRAKARKDSKIEVPKNIKGSFVLLSKEISYKDLFKKLLEESLSVENFLQQTYDFVKQHTEVLKDSQIKTLYREKLLKHLGALSEQQELPKIEIYLFLEEFFQDHLDQALTKVIEGASDIEFLVQSLSIAALKKKFLVCVRKHRTDWEAIFSHLFFNVSHHFLREYLYKELMKSKDQDCFKNTVRKLIDHPVLYPDCFVWYFQKIQTTDELPFSDAAGRNLFFEALFILLYHIENESNYTDLTKKVHSLIVSNHFKLFRDNIAETSIEFAREILLLITKCQIFNTHDFKVFLSLAKVVHPELKEEGKGGQPEEDRVIWTTKEGYQKIQERIQEIATVETVENAKEIEIARSYGDLRENSEYKFAQEKRARLQTEMKLLSSQLSQARILSPEDVDVKKVSVGTIVELVNPQGKPQQYTILGPWDADPDKGILSFQSQLAKSMLGLQVDESFDFKSGNYTVKNIRSYLE